jgi:hypothetical protein
LPTVANVFVSWRGLDPKKLTTTVATRGSTSAAATASAPWARSYRDDNAATLSAVTAVSNQHTKYHYAVIADATG